MEFEFDKLDFNSTQQLLLKNKISCRQLTAYYLKKVNEGEHLNAFISIFGKRALVNADKVDLKLKESQAGKLAGLVMAIKDNINFKGEKTTCASKILANFISPYSATVVQRLEQADAIIIGKTNMDEFAMGSSNENSFFKPVKNPYDVSRVPGGSSGGSATTVAASMAMAALGSDTGGSIRQPASFCGVVGLKPTYGRVSRSGLIAYASSFDQIGPITRSVEDCARLLEVIAGCDPKDSTSADLPVPEYSTFLNQSINELTIGLPDEYYGAGLDPEVKEQLKKLIKLLEQQGAKIINLSLPHSEYSIAAYYILATAEASSNLARFDGAHYGYRSGSVADLEDMFIKTRSDGFSDEVKRRIMLGTYVLSAGYYEAYYQRAQKVRTLIKHDFDEAFKLCDCIITPTAPTTAFKIGDKINDPLTMYLSDIYTVSANLTGIPALSLPCGCDSNGMPIGLQIMAKHFDEQTIFQVASLLEQLLAK